MERLPVPRNLPLGREWYEGLDSEYQPALLYISMF